MAFRAGIKSLNAAPQIINFTDARVPGTVASMNTGLRFREGITAGVSITAALIALASAQPGRAQDKAPSAPERIGIYESRAVAVAYAGSEAQVTKMKALTTRMKQARESGDTNTMMQLEAEGRAWQSKLMRQGFGTAPVDDLLAEIGNELPMIQQTAGVTRFISKWNKAELKRHPQAAQVDVTMRLVDAFQPNPTQRQRALEIQKTKPQKIKE